jgi:hypothetical protein
MKLTALLVEPGLRDSNLAHDMFTTFGVDYDHVKTLPQAFGALARREYDIIVTTTQDNGGPIGPKVVRRIEELGQEPVIVALGSESEEALWNGVRPDYFFPKFGDGVFYTGYKFRDIIQERF